MKRTFVLIFTGSLLTLAAWLAFPNHSYAHPYSASYGELAAYDNVSIYNFSLDELSVIELTEGIDTNQDSALSEEEANDAGAKDRIQDWFAAKISILADDVPLNGTLTDVRLETKNGTKMVTLEYHYPALKEGATLRIEDRLYDDGTPEGVQFLDGYTNYVQFLTFHNGRSVLEHIFQSGSREYSVVVNDGLGSYEGELPEADNTEYDGNWLQFLRLGMKHIITGYDHLMFLLSLILIRQTLKQNLKIVTSFTIAHSITLTLGALDIVSIPSSIVEPIIAISIVYVALENLFIREKVKHRPIITFVFGLVHGLGFAGVIQVLDLPASQIAASLFSFNLGIEVVQVALLLLLVPLLRYAQKSPVHYSRGMRVISVAIALVAGYWAFERIFYA